MGRVISVFLMAVSLAITGCGLTLTSRNGDSISLVPPQVTVIQTPAVVTVPAPVVVEPYVPYYYTPQGCCWHFWQGGHHGHHGGHHRR